MRTDRENRARGCARALAYVKRNAKFDSVLCVETFNAQFNFPDSFLSQPVTPVHLQPRDPYRDSSAAIDRARRETADDVSRPPLDPNNFP